jgi:hypothetical protein
MTRRVRHLERLEALARPSTPMERFQLALNEAAVRLTGKREPAGSPNIEWCQFEERLGPVPSGSEAPSLDLYLTEDDMRL